MIRSLVRIFLTAMAFATFSSAASASSTETVWEHHIAAWNARDLKDIASDYDEASVLILNGRTFRGTEEIKGAFARLFEIFDGGDNRIDPPVLDGRIVYITWHFTPHGGFEHYGTDTFVIEKGKIAVQTIASPLYDQFPVLPTAGQR